MRFDDPVIQSILDEIKVEVQQKYKIDLTKEEIYKVIKVQIASTILGISKHVSVHWRGFGKFVFNNTVKRIKDINVFEAQIRSDDYDLTEKEKLDLKKSFIATKAREREANFKKQISGNAISVKELESKQDKQVVPTVFRLIK